MANTRPQRPNKFITFDQLTFDLLQEASEATGLTFSHIVDQFMLAHVDELIEFNSWIKRQEGDARARGIHALNPYGPHTLITEMQRIDPTYQPPAVRMRAEMNQADVSDLLAMLADWKAKRATEEARQ